MATSDGVVTYPCPWVCNEPHHWTSILTTGEPGPCVQITLLCPGPKWKDDDVTATPETDAPAP